MKNLLYVYVYVWLSTQIYTHLVGLGRQHHALVSSPMHSQGKRPSTFDSQGETSQKPRRDRNPNWTIPEMLALVSAKHHEYLQKLDVVNGQDLMEFEVTKWGCISNKVKAFVFSMHYWDKMDCKGKWHFILPYYCRVANYHARTNISNEDYWLLTLNELVVKKLPKAFPKNIYIKIHKWFGHRP